MRFFALLRMKKSQGFGMTGQEVFAGENKHQSKHKKRCRCEEERRSNLKTRLLRASALAMTAFFKRLLECPAYGYYHFCKRSHAEVVKDTKAEKGQHSNLSLRGTKREISWVCFAWARNFGFAIALNDTCASTYLSRLL
ncbi:MAG: hypothetical protein AYP45_10820 [Candidatus Brocadia carolinensis]|uniref:Uncharacterized protein n=1 Tax=Candidatus Brocadia carolinensis TaxID=1004156 RepID=A0A1V4ASN9_9BACT|nr:MAG: hypothetical protein AYP45_10820 [Candidatus Brocadia caroliniensis]